MNNIAKKWIKFLIIDIIGVIIFVFAWISFVVPNKAGLGGITGIAAIVDYIFKKGNLGTLVMLFNIPTFILALIYLSREFCIKTGITIAMISQITNLTKPIFPTFTGHRFLLCIIGGLLMGVGIGLVFKVGGATGGSDIVSNLIMLKNPHFKIGVVMLVLDAVVILASAVVYKDIKAVFFGYIVSFLYTRVVDFICKPHILAKLS
ncbi:MAG: YitT family protein [Oscillospiraceae bacterium]|jgi:uncharacterized membrane-anchored protein YitT (DUF2179 family)|nr:YitT family protein [Oscillospiraceae bacterium]